MTRTLSRALFCSAVLLIVAGVTCTVVFHRDLWAVVLLLTACVSLGVDIWLTYLEGDQ